MSVTYSIRTTMQITIGLFRQVIDCPVCGATFGVCLSTSGGWKPVTGSCPADHVWDEQRVDGSEVKQAAIEMAGEGS